jgi:DNA-directed RNA polymerase beta subunit
MFRRLPLGHEVEEGDTIIDAFSFNDEHTPEAATLDIENLIGSTLKDISYGPSNNDTPDVIGKQDIIGNQFFKPRESVSRPTAKDNVSSKFVPEDLQYDQAGKLFETYYQSETFASPFIKAFNNFVNVTLPNQIRSREVVVRDRISNEPTHKIVFDKVDYVLPKITPMFARLNERTYSAKIYITYKVFIMHKDLTNPHKFHQGEVIMGPNQFYWCDLPVMIGSILDPASKDEFTKIENQECYKDPGGYFIIRGGEKSINNQEHLRVNRFFTMLGKQLDKGRAVAQMITSNIYGTDAIVLYEGEMNSVDVHLAPFGRTNDAKTKPIKINVYRLFRMMAKYEDVISPDGINATTTKYRNPQYITELILSFVPKPWKSTIADMLLINETIVSGSGTDSSGSTVAADEIDLSMIERQNEDIKLPDDILHRIDMSFFSHMSAPRHRKMPMINKLQMLAHMTARLCEVIAKLRLPDDRDDWGNKRVDTPAKSCEILYSKFWADFTIRLNIALNGGSSYNAKSVSIDVKKIPDWIKLLDEKNPYNESIRKSFMGQSWGLQGSGRKKVEETMVESVKREQSIAAIYSNVLRVTTSVNKRTRSEKLRAATGSQYGYVCLIETPEGPGCGIVKHLTVMCYPSIEQDENNMEHYILDLIENNNIAFSDSPDSEANSSLILNGRFMGWVDGVKCKLLLTEDRRSGKIDMTTGLVLKPEGPTDAAMLRDHIRIANGCSLNTPVDPDRLYTLNVYTDSGRLTRPVLVVDQQTKRLMIEVKNMWTKPWEELIANGIIEYIDAHEQHYIIIEQNLMDYQKKFEALEMFRRKIAFIEHEVNDISKQLANQVLRPKYRKWLDDSLATKTIELTNAKQELVKRENKFIYTHCEIDPAALLGFSASTSPFPHTNQAPRNVYQCLDEYEEILMYDGSYKMMRDLKNGDSIITINPTTFAEEVSKIYNVQLNNPRDHSQQLWKVCTSNGRYIYATNDHPFLTQRGFVKTEDLDPKHHALLIKYRPDEEIIATPLWELLTETGNNYCYFMQIESCSPIELCTDELSMSKKDNLVGCFTTVSSNHTYVSKQGFVTHNCGMSKQSVAYYTANEMARMDPQTKIMAYPSTPTFMPQILKMLGLNELGSGTMVILAIAVFEGMNQEDAIIINEDAINSGLFMMKKNFVESITMKKNDVIQNPRKHPYVGKTIRASEENDYLYSALDDDGLPKIGHPVSTGMYVLGIVRKKGEGESAIYTNESVKLGVYESGVIDQVFIGINEDGETIVNIKISDVRMTIEGWKFAPRMAQKGTSAVIRKSKDMPKIMYGRNRGVTPSIIINPHAIPARMTISLLMEGIASIVGGLSGQHINASAFRPFEEEEFKRVLREHGAEDNGWQLMMDSRSGEPFASQVAQSKNPLETPLGTQLDSVDVTSQLVAKIYVVPCMYQMLRHQVEDKYQHRATGRSDIETHQPVKGRKEVGGSKAGEMEQTAIISHGASEYLHDTLCNRSDAYEAIYCKNCHKMTVAEPVSDGIYRCRICRKEGSLKDLFGRVIMSYSFIKVMRMLQVMGIQTTTANITAKPGLLPPDISYA